MLPKLESRITVPTGGWDVAVTDSGGGPETVTVAAGDYYLAGATSILTALQTALNANATLAATYTVSVDDDAGDDTDTGTVTISSTGGGNVTWTWTDTAFRDALGYTINMSGAQAYLGASSSPHIFLPNVGRTNVMSPEPTSGTVQMGASEYDYLATRSPSGEVVQLTYNERYMERLEFFNLLGKKTWTAHESTTNESLQTWIQTLQADGGVPFKLFPDRSDDSLAWQWVFANLHFQPSPTVPNWVGTNSLWQISYDLYKK